MKVVSCVAKKNSAICDFLSVKSICKMAGLCCPYCWLFSLLSTLCFVCWHADVAEVFKGIRALAPNSPDIAVAADSNQHLVDNYVKVIYPYT